LYVPRSLSGSVEATATGKKISETNNSKTKLDSIQAVGDLDARRGSHSFSPGDKLGIHIVLPREMRI
jgi:hypothetical protein